MIRQIRNATVAVACLSAQGVAMAQDGKPSFDCAKARTAIEMSICKDREVANLDRMVADYYQAFLKALPPESKFQRDLRATQRTWLRRRNKVCGRAKDADARAACLLQFYEGRISGLARLYHRARGGKPNRGVAFISGWYAARQPGIGGKMLILEWPDERVSGGILTVRTNRGAHTCTLDMEKMSRKGSALTYVSQDDGSKGCTLTIRIVGSQAQVKAAACLRQYWCGAAGFMSGRYVRIK